jgi:hypothetical protein
MVTFKEDTHQYFLGDLELPSVTTILKEIGYVDDRWFRPEHAERGKNIHKAIELYEMDDLDWGSIEEELPYLERWIEFKEANQIQVQYTEHIVHHPDFMYAGTIDWVGVLNDRPTIIDFKSGHSLWWHKAQLCMYAACGKTEEEPLLATFNLKYGKLTPYEFDLPLVEAICKVYGFKARRGK